jgi:hypothetical protein
MTINYNSAEYLNFKAEQLRREKKLAQLRRENPNILPKEQAPEFSEESRFRLYLKLKVREQLKTLDGFLISYTPDCERIGDAELNRA